MKPVCKLRYRVRTKKPNNTLNKTIIHPIVWVPYEKSPFQHPKNKLHSDMVSIQKTSMSFGENISTILGSDYVEIFFDDANRLIAFKPSTDIQKAIHFNKKIDAHKNNRLNMSKILQGKNIKHGLYPANWSDKVKMLIVQYEVPLPSKETNESSNPLFSSDT